MPVSHTEPESVIKVFALPGSPIILVFTQ